MDVVYVNRDGENLELRYSLPARMIAAPDKNGCELWLRKPGGGGYGYRYGILVHRLAYVSMHGEIPDGLDIDHRCHVKLCVNPLHLQAVTNKENSENRLGAQKNNRSSGIRGVTWLRSRGVWRVQVRHNGESYYGGHYADLVDAEKAAIALRNRLFTNNLKDLL